MNKIVISLALAMAASSPSWPQVIIRVGPPRVVVERPTLPPGPRYVWTSGFYRWESGRYIWVPGRYVVPPRPGSVWIAPRWVERNGAWFFVEGYWR
jgi:hypothetical protein